VKLRFAGLGLLALLAGCGPTTTIEWQCRVAFEKAQTARDSLRIVTNGLEDGWASLCAQVMAKDQLAPRANAERAARKAGK
jgi:hypothetical protein